MIKVAVIEDSKAMISVYKSYLENTEFEWSVFSSKTSDINQLIKEVIHALTTQGYL